MYSKGFAAVGFRKWYRSSMHISLGGVERAFLGILRMHERIVPRSGTRPSLLGGGDTFRATSGFALHMPSQAYY